MKTSTIVLLMVTSFLAGILLLGTIASIYTAGAKSVCEDIMDDSYTCEWQMVATNYNLRKAKQNEN